MTSTASKPFRTTGHSHNSAVAALTSQQPAIASSEGMVLLPENPEDKDATLSGAVTSVPRELRFSPYDFNGGTVAAVAGPDYAVVASDTRLSSG